METRVFIPFIILVTICASIPNLISAQDEGLQLIRVEFWYPKEGTDNWVRIKEDGLSEVEISEANKTKSWMLNESGTVIQKPVAYVSGSTPRIGACFRNLGSENFCTDPGDPPSAAPFYGRGEVVNQEGQPVGMSLPIQQLVKTGAEGLYEYVVMPTNVAFQTDKVQYFEKFKIKWEWSNSANPDGKWEIAGESENRLYTTYAKPTTSLPHFYTCLHIGCTMGDGKTQKIEIFNAIQSHFASKNIKRVDDDDRLKYWGDPVLTRQNPGIECLLENGVGAAYEDGRCGSWVDFFDAVLSVQGISGNKIKALAYNPAGVVGFFSDDPLENEFLIKVEQFFGNVLFPTPDHPDNPTNILLDNADPELNLPGTGIRLILHGKTAINMMTGNEEMVIISRFFVKGWSFDEEEKFYAVLPVDATLEVKNPNGDIVQEISGADENGVGAQGNDNPVSNFDDHVLYRYNNQYYDPSYGAGPFADKSAWVTGSLSGYGTIITYIAPNMFNYKILWLHQKASASNSGIIKFN